MSVQKLYPFCDCPIQNGLSPGCSSRATIAGKRIGVDKLVTIGGECFGAEYEDEAPAQDRVGIYYHFRLKDLTRDRGERLVSVFVTRSDKVLTTNYDNRIETVRLNVIRRAFDAGMLSFDRTTDPDRYEQLPVKSSDFQPQRAASPSDIQNFIKHKAYWLGFRNSAVDRHFTQYDDEIDLEYLGVPKSEVDNRVWLLTQNGFLQPSGLPGVSRPTAKLVYEYESSVRQTLEPTGGAVTNIYHIYGNNSRINVQSTNQSVNVSTVTSEQLFVNLRNALMTALEGAERIDILQRD
jgi:hypothetical protein